MDCVCNLLWIPIIAGYTLSSTQTILDTFITVTEFYALTSKRPALRAFYRLSSVSLVIGFGCHIIWLMERGLRTGRYPLVGTKETLAFLSLCLIVSFIAVKRRYRANALNACLSVIGLGIAVIASFAPETIHSPHGINEPLQRILFPFHAGLMLLSYAAFFLAFSAGLMYMIQERELKKKRFGPIFDHLPSLEVCDAISLKSSAIGFILLTLGIAAGFAWSRARDGVFWHGGLTEVFSVATLGVYFFIVQFRIMSGLSGRTSALVSIIGFVLAICNLVGIRYLSDLHIAA